MTDRAPPELIVLRFNDAINQRDLWALVALMTEDHRFVDSAGSETVGREAMREAWRGFFSAFPDYRNAFDTVTSRGDTVLVTGRSECSVPALEGPAIWVAEVRDGMVATWTVHEDTPAVRESLGIHETPT